jgi:hypothetical protein
MDLLLGSLVWGAIAALILVAVVRRSRGGAAGRGRPAGGRGAVGAAHSAAPRPPTRPATDRMWTAGTLPEEGPRGDAAFIDGAVLGYYLAREHFDRRLEELEVPPAAAERDLGADDDLGAGGEVAADVWAGAADETAEIDGFDEAPEHGFEDGLDDELGGGIGDGLGDGFGFGGTVDEETSEGDGFDDGFDDGFGDGDDEDDDW